MTRLFNFFSFILYVYAGVCAAQQGSHLPGSSEFPGRLQRMISRQNWIREVARTWPMVQHTELIRM
jgi:hypothetical protein